CPRSRLCSRRRRVDSHPRDLALVVLLFVPRLYPLPLLDFRLKLTAPRALSPAPPLRVAPRPEPSSRSPVPGCPPGDARDVGSRPAALLLTVLTVSPDTRRYRGVSLLRDPHAAILGGCDAACA